MTSYLLLLKLTDLQVMCGTTFVKIGVVRDAMHYCIISSCKNMYKVENMRGDKQRHGGGRLT